MGKPTLANTRSSTREPGGEQRTAFGACRIAFVWRSVAVPTLLNIALSARSAWVLCYVLANLLLHVPGIRRVL